MKQCKNMEIWFAELPINPGHVEHGKRPVLILSNDTANKFSPIITMVPLTSETQTAQQSCGMGGRSIFLSTEALSLEILRARGIQLKFGL